MALSFTRNEDYDGALDILAAIDPRLKNNGTLPSREIGDTSTNR
jgi:hypothetical protein